jgi:hypothetical protein
MKNSLEYFDRIYIINLLSRKNRLKEIEQQLKNIGMSLSSNNIFIFPGIRPTESDEFPTIGARGCFLSHYEIIKISNKLKINNFLIIEDDLNFSKNFEKIITEAIIELKNTQWSIFYGGYKIHQYKIKKTNNKIYEISNHLPVGETHFIAFNNEITNELLDYLYKILQRKGGDPEGGPMHIDGAYSWFRNSHPKFKTFICIPELGYQRSSRTDVRNLDWFDKSPIIKNLIAIARIVKKFIISKFK